MTLRFRAARLRGEVLIERLERLATGVLELQPAAREPTALEGLRAEIALQPGVKLVAPGLLDGQSGRSHDGAQRVRRPDQSGGGEAPPSGA